MRNIIWAVAALITLVSCSNEKPLNGDNSFSVTTSLIEVTDVALDKCHFGGVSILRR
jgi:hypothetical protein